MDADLLAGVIAAFFGAGVGMGTAGISADGFILSAAAAIAVTPMISDLFNASGGKVEEDLDAGPAALRGDRRAGAARRPMHLAARLMPQTVGGRWLAEAESFLFEVTPQKRRKATSNYLITAPRVIVVSWGGELARRARLVIGSRTVTRPGDADDDANR